MHPKNGDISFSNGVIFGSMATYSCDPPFFIIGGRIRVCQTNGEWSGEAPHCESMLVFIATMGSEFSIHDQILLQHKQIQWLTISTVVSVNLFSCH